MPPKARNLITRSLVFFVFSGEGSTLPTAIRERATPYELGNAPPLAERTKMEDQDILEKINSLYDTAEQAHKETRTSGFPWDEREQLFFNKYKHPLEKTKSILSTGELTTLTIDRACRVMAQLPSGRFYNVSGKPGANMAMNLIFEHYVLPNANQGGTMLAKLRTIDMYSGVFGTIPAFIEWVANDKYLGPDLRMIHPRRAKPQAGKNSLGEMEVFFVDTEVSRDFLESKKGSGVWKDIDKVLAHDQKKLDEGTGSEQVERSPDERNKTKTGITLRHSFFANGDWIVDHKPTGTILVKEAKWYCDLPISAKHQYPKLDSFWSYSDFERGELSQKSIDTLTRLHLDGLDKMIDPPMVTDPEQVVLSSLNTKRYYVKNGNYGAITFPQINPQALNAFQSTYPVMRANLLSLSASGDTSISKETDAGFGKTPEALKQQGARQGARDAWDTAMMKDFIEDSFTKMANLIAMKGLNKIAFQLLGTSIQKIKEQYPGEDFSILGEDWENGNVEIDVNVLKEQVVNEKGEYEYIPGEFRYVMDEGSTLVKKDDTSAQLLEFVKIYNQFPQIQMDLQMRGQRFDQGEAFKRAITDIGIQDAEKIIVTEENPESLNGIGSEGASVMPEEQMLQEQMLQEQMMSQPQQMPQL